MIVVSRRQAYSFRKDKMAKEPLIAINNEGLPILIDRDCSCGYHIRLAFSYRISYEPKLAGLYVDCPVCHSTLFIPFSLPQSSSAGNGSISA